MFERCLYFNLNAVARKVNAIWDQAFRELELSPAHAYLLRVVLETPGLTQQAIATELKLEKSTVARFVDVLEKRGYLRRDRVGRERPVYPTDSAKAVRDELENRGDALYAQMTRALGRESLVALVNDLRRTANKL